VNLSQVAAGSPPGSVISSASRNVKLEGGTQVVVHIIGAAGGK
jgi:hypothetical protein